MARHTDITITVTASGPEDVRIRIATVEVANRAETADTKWEFTVSKIVWKQFITLAPGFTRTVRVQQNEEEK